MSFWANDPAPPLVAVFTDILEQRMQGLPILNRELRIEAVGFRSDCDGHWTGALITPWAVNLLRLPGHPDWPATAPGGRHDWVFASGNYEFTVAEEARLGVYHLCSLFSPAVDFPTHEQAHLTALAAMLALGALPPPPGEVTRPSGRRAFLGLGR